MKWKNKTRGTNVSTNNDFVFPVSFQVYRCGRSALPVARRGVTTKHTIVPVSDGSNSKLVAHA